MNNSVFIPSRGRWTSAPKLIQIWRQQGFSVHFVVEPGEHSQYFVYKDDDVHVWALPIENGGIGYSRMHCVNLADSWGMKSIVLSDDDIKPNAKFHMNKLIKSAAHPKVLGVTARYGYHDLCLGALIRDRNDLILLPTGTFRLVALNIKNVHEIGNYDRKLQYAEDCDLFLRGLKAGFPWLIHLGTRANSMGARYQPGGMLDFAGGSIQLADKKEQWHEKLYQKYPDVVNDPDHADFTKQNSIRIQWRKAYDKYLPGWKKWSALHGGYLAHYLGVADAT